ncbi:MAG: hypothetical protein HY053_04840, partial [Proteobacteria bacterium]|nr:hypothetical protein [Pseudomonadota bacterium]
MAQDLPYATKLAAATPAAIPDFEARPSDSLRLPRLTKALLAAQKPRVLA